MCDKTFSPVPRVTHFWGAMVFDAKHCSHVLKVKIDYIFGFSFIHSHEYISFQENT